MDRREFLALTGASALRFGGRNLLQDLAQSTLSARKADFTIRIGPVSTELAPNRIVRTTGYNGSAPGPLLRMAEGKQISVDVFNQTDVSELVHWHGQLIPSEVDGSADEGTPSVPARGHRRYTFTPRPAGVRWYHAHDFAGRNLHRGIYTGQFGFLYIEPRNNPGSYDQEHFLALRDWGPFFTAEEEEEEDACMPPDGPRVTRASYQVQPTANQNGLEVGYKAFSINDRALGHGEPIRVRQGERVLLHILNASATEIRRVSLPGHTFRVVALDGNPVPMPASVEAIQIAPAERVDAIVEMNQPGVWIFGTTNDEDREDGMGIVFEYAGRQGEPRWIAPGKIPWDYSIFGRSAVAPAPRPDGTFHLVFKKIPGGKGGYNRWLINGKSFPDTDPLIVHQGRRYRLIFDNQSDDAHPVHLHRHIFELTKVDGRNTAGVMKDTVLVKPNRPVEVDFVADNPGLTLFHCHQQLHMDFGFMTMLKYA